MTTYLPDSSIWSWTWDRRRDDIVLRFSTRFAAGELLTCAPVVLEATHRARTSREFDSLVRDYFDPLELLPLDARASARALEVQRELARSGDGAHRRSAPDFLIAAIAEQAGVVLWHYDRDLDVICRHTGQPQEYEGAAETP
jgi:predicted nucleic acid-binding protein